MTAVANEKISHKERLLRQGTKLFYEKGYHGTSVDAVLEASEVPKGSFYHHFSSKEKFALAILSRYFEYQRNLTQYWADQTNLTTIQKLDGYFQSLGEMFAKSNYTQGCLAGKFATELSSSSATVRAHLSQDFDAWKNILNLMLQHGQQVGDIRKDIEAIILADLVMTLIQGSFVISLAHQDVTTVHTIEKILSKLLSP